MTPAEAGSQCQLFAGLSFTEPPPQPRATWYMPRIHCGTLSAGACITSPAMRLAPSAVQPAHGPNSSARQVLPAAVAGGGLVAPVPANAPPVPSPPPGYIQPAPVFSPWSPLGQTGFLAANLPVSPPVVAPSMAETASALPPLTPETTFPVTPTTPTTPTTPGSPSTPSTPGSPVPEPGSLSVLLGGVAVLLLMRQLAAASQARTRRSCGGAHQSSDPSSA